MKHTLFLLLLPCASFAQNTRATTTDKPFLKVHFNIMKMITHDDREDKNECSRITIYDGDFLLTDTMPVDKLPVKRHRRKPDYNCRAEQVAISYNYSQVLKGDVLEYDAVHKKGILKGHVSLSKNGVDEPVGKYAMLDLSDNRYMIEKLK